MSLTVGVEEEFLLLDPRGGATVPRGAEVLAGADWPGGRPELRASVVESVTGVCADLGDLRGQLAAGRRALAAAAEREGVLVAPAGTPPCPGAPAPATPGARFAGIERRYAGVVTGYEVCGCHVHVGVDDPDTAVAVINHLRPWLPTLLALSVNSPFDRGTDTGYGSWRMITQARFPGSGIPPRFASAAEYRAAVGGLVDCGTLIDPGMSFWLARPSPRWPTVEFRVADTALTVADAVAQAELARALVAAALARLDEDPPELDPQVAAAAVWSAARYGMDGPAVDPLRACRVSAGRRLAELRDFLLPEDRDMVLPAVSGARRQREAGGWPGLRAVFRAAMVGTP
ncbi:carboxylate-amine ligase [Amycolatopsis suaedae]|uniref:carboxylate-amine ligase n=1 Tax=Amycolatopsis suaedae TaxID=2510978 RepID=UPI001F0E2DBC|nr:YbdK family carboxylate-amine ligase [Amycolatopsis suaedae]